MSQKQVKRSQRDGRAQGSRSEQMESPRVTFEAALDRWGERLQGVVPLLILRLHERGGITRRDMFCAYLAMEAVGMSADRYLSGRCSAEEAADLFNKTARSISVLAYVPGGVPAFGRLRREFDAEALLAGFIGAASAREHVAGAVRRCFEKAPISQEPLGELAQRLLAPARGDRGSAGPIYFLTEEDDPPRPEPLARALVAYLAIEDYLARRRRRPILQEQEVLVRLNSDGGDDELLAPVAAALRAMNSAQQFYADCTRWLETCEKEHPGRMGSLSSFILTGDKMVRAVFQHLAVLVACQQVWVIERDLPDDQNYHDVLDTWSVLLPVLE
jgi:hypothetical protein